MTEMLIELTIFVQHVSSITENKKVKNEYSDIIFYFVWNVFKWFLVVMIREEYRVGISQPVGPSAV